jgi:hypothetical protein
VLTLAINNVPQKEEATMKFLLVLGVHNPQSTVCYLVRNTPKVFTFLTRHCFCYSLMSTIRMKFDPAIHISMHLFTF